MIDPGHVVGPQSAQGDPGEVVPADLILDAVEADLEGLPQTLGADADRQGFETIVVQVVIGAAANDDVDRQ